MVKESRSVIIVGAGPAGLACAIAVADAGGHATLIEKSTDLGGALHVSTGQMAAAGTRRQAEHGIDDSAERHYEEIVSRSGDEIDRALVHLAVARAADTVNWLEDIGLELDPKTPTTYYGHEPYRTPRTYWPADGAAGAGVLAVLRSPLERAVAAGRVDVLTGHRVRDLIVDEGVVVGVRAVADESEVEFRGHAVVLTTGGYGADPKLYAEMSPSQPRMVTVCPATATGDGLRLARTLGAAVRNGDHQLQTVGVLEPEPGSGRAGQPPVWAPMNPHLRRPLELHVNERGERFLAEDDPGIDRRERAVMAQPGQRCWVVFDDEVLRSDPFLPGRDGDDVRRLAHEERAAWSADDVPSLALRAGIDPDGLATTVTDWNTAVVVGSDPLGRIDPAPALDTPPYYAVLVYAAVILSFGGIRVDTDLRVLHEDGSPIPGLHAAGEILGAGALSGNFFWGGMAVTPALAFGRLLGQALGAGVEPHSLSAT